MSRYVELVVELPRLDRDGLARALSLLGLEPVLAAPGERLMLEGSLECAGEPVDLRLEPGSAGAVEDFGFRLDQGRVALICGDVDRRHLEREVTGPLRQAVTAEATRQRLEAAGLEIEEHVEADGTRRIQIKR